MKTICVIGGGWSARGVDFAKLPGLKVGVNDAGLLSKSDLIISMDRLWAENRWKSLLARGQATWLRRSAITNLIPAYPTVTSPRWCVVFECDHTSSKFAPKPEPGEPRVLNGTNSGFCALNWVYQYDHVETVYLVGFDMCRSPEGDAYWHSPYPWAKPQGGTGNKRYAEWATQFENAAHAFKKRGVRVVNASLNSAIEVWPKIHPMEIPR